MSPSMNVMHDSHDDVEVKPRSWVKKPVLAARSHVDHAVAHPLGRLEDRQLGALLLALGVGPRELHARRRLLVGSRVSARRPHDRRRKLPLSPLPSAPLPSRARSGEPGSGAAAGAAAAALMNAWNAAICTTSGWVTSSARCACSAARAPARRSCHPP